MAERSPEPLRHGGWPAVRATCGASGRAFPARGLGRAAGRSAARVRAHEATAWDSRMRLRPRGSFGLEADDITAPFSEIWDAFFAGQILVFRGLELSAREFLAFARQLGHPDPHVIDQCHHPEPSAFLILSNVRKDGQPTGLAHAGTSCH